MQLQIYRMVSGTCGWAESVVVSVRNLVVMLVP